MTTPTDDELLKTCDHILGTAYCKSVKDVARALKSTTK